MSIPNCPDLTEADPEIVGESRPKILMLTRVTAGALSQSDGGTRSLPAHYPLTTRSLSAHYGGAQYRSFQGRGREGSVKTLRSSPAD